MLFDEFPIALPFYDYIGKQNRFKENGGQALVFDLWALSNELIPFQFRNELGAVLTSLQVFTEDGVLAESLDPDFILSEAVSGYQYFTWFADESFKNLLGVELALDCSVRYYLKASFGALEPIYSEVMSIFTDTSKMLVIEWSNTIGSIDPVYYGSLYRNRMYVDTFITKGLPTIITNSEKDGFGNTIVVSKVMVDNYDVSFLIVPNFIVLAINFLSLHNDVVIITKDELRIGNIENITIDQEQVNNQAIFEVTLKFNQPKFYYSGSCSTPIDPPAEEEDIIINTGTPQQEFDLIYDAN